jgi:hypothetical protein
MDDGTIEVNGDFRMWWDEADKGICRLVIDKHLIVRNAAITYRYEKEQRTRKIEISTKGLQEWDDGRLRTAVSGSIHDHTMETNSTRGRFDVSLQNIQFDLADAEFNNFMALSPPAGVKPAVIDYGRLAEKGAANREKLQKRRVPLTQSDSRVPWLIPANLVVIALLLYMWYRRSHGPA